MPVDLVGYTNRFSARPGQSIDFKISNQLGLPVQARLYRSVSADPNPAGPGLIEIPCDSIFAPIEFSIGSQPFYPGSYARSFEEVLCRGLNFVELAVRIYPTLFKLQTQTVMTYGPIRLKLQSNGIVSFEVGDADRVSSSFCLSLHKWYSLRGRVSVKGVLSLSVECLGTNLVADFQQESTSVSLLRDSLSYPVCLAALLDGAKVASQFFNGKIEAPRMIVDDIVVASWDLSACMMKQEVPSELSTSSSTCTNTLLLINAPTRAMRSSQWDASELNWRHKPDHYAAIHFHEDDIYDFNWDTSFSFTPPTHMQSGIYVMRITCNGHEDALPFFICPPKGTTTAKLCVLVSTFTYVIYGNHARSEYSSTAWRARVQEWESGKAYPHNPAEHPEYGLSTYNLHSDGSGICHASHKRPLFNFRPGYITFGAATCSGLRHFPADSHLISWLHHHHIDYDILTDSELDNEGPSLLSGYSAVTTGTHPEYYTKNMLDALSDYRDGGGSLMYLGGNGFYWRIARHEQDPDLLEIRRAEDGLRAWASEPGEYYHAFDGSYGGLWRRNGRPPQRLVGVGFTAQGQFEGMPYYRTCRDRAFDWVFEGVEKEAEEEEEHEEAEEGAPLGDFGFSGGGAAGYELDRVDTKLDEGLVITILAQAYDQRASYMLVPEEQLTHLSNLSGTSEAEVKRADMVYFTTPTGGQVFSVGSITFCGSLPWNNFDNNISKLLLNVMKRFLE
mmetsp:Transcript_14107/g.23466  ORF Transcript_14107/g.23466 Transcript_14107/m.23466 type:complete len:729 (-) Transcript_14107:57-2243(-)